MKPDESSRTALAVSGSPGLTLTVTGNNFFPSSTIKWGRAFGREAVAKEPIVVVDFETHTKVQHVSSLSDSLREEHGFVQG